MWCTKIALKASRIEQQLVSQPVSAWAFKVLAPKSTRRQNIGGGAHYRVIYMPETRLRNGFVIGEFI